MKVIVFVDWFYPAYKAGGPIKSVYNIIQTLKDKFEFLVVSSKYDIDQVELDVIENKLTSYQGIPIIYLSKKVNKVQKIKAIVKEFKPEFIYLNSMFSTYFTIIPLLLFGANQRYKTIVAPRGMLGEGALRFKQTKKRVFIEFLKLIGLPKKITWHASTENEAIEIQQQFGANLAIVIAQNIASVYERKLNSLEKKKGFVKFCFVSRISRKKNLDYFLRVLDQIEDKSSFIFDIYGPIEDQQYWEECLEFANFEESINYKGILHPVTINETLCNYHFFVLPSLNENYGHVIAESLISGVPVLISDQTPWRNLEENNAGFSLPLNNNRLWVEKIKELIAMEKTAYDKYLVDCKRYCQEFVFSEAVIAENKKLFELHEA